MAKPKPNAQPISDRAINDLFAGTTLNAESILVKRGMMIDCILCYAAGRRDSYTITTICTEAGFLTPAKRPSKAGFGWAWMQLYDPNFTILERLSRK